MPHPSPDMSPEAFRAAGHRVVDWIADYLADPRRYPIQPDRKPGELIDALPSHAPEQGEPIEAILRDFESLIVPASTLWNHPQFYSFFSVSSSGPGILAEALIAALNMNGMLWKSSPAVTELEQVTLNWLREWLGLPESNFGIIHDTASNSTLHAILAARHAAQPAQRAEGAQPGYVLYCSEHAHSSVEKGALALGVGEAYVRKIATDAEFRMKPDALQEAIDADRAAGLHPFCVVATVGTTSMTSVDPVPAIAAICERENLWLHIDAAYGGHAGLVPEYRHYLDGCDRADSFVINPHKWLFTPIDCSVLYTRRPEVFREALAMTPAYLRSNYDPRQVNFMDFRIPLGSRFRALKLWFVMRYFGRDHIVGIIRSHIQMAQHLAAEIASDERFEIAAPTTMSLVCFRLKGSDEANEKLLAAMQASGAGFFSQTVLHGRLVIRWAIGNIHTTEEDLQRSWQVVRSLVP
ncbi:MAG: amino acid decarboxylase [Bryobacterales bacterium]|nr:amino acid decarboxylase [Bryobacterales bacterium]